MRQINPRHAPGQFDNELLLLGGLLAVSMFTFIELRSELDSPSKWVAVSAAVSALPLLSVEILRGWGDRAEQRRLRRGVFGELLLALSLCLPLVALAAWVLSVHVLLAAALVASATTAVIGYTRSVAADETAGETSDSAPAART
jgi:hypothetical protein